MARRRALKEQGEALGLQLDSSKETYLHALAQYEMARLQQQETDSDATLISSAGPAMRSALSRGKLYILASVASLALGVGWPFAYEHLSGMRRRAQRTRRQDPAAPA
jgi:uncharacterized protein involved in exopolysaccharide biosynthesis